MSNDMVFIRAIFAAIHAISDFIRAIFTVIHAIFHYSRHNSRHIGVNN